MMSSSASSSGSYGSNNSSKVQYNSYHTDLKFVSTYNLLILVQHQLHGLRLRIGHASAPADLRLGGAWLRPGLRTTRVSAHGMLFNSVSGVGYVYVPYLQFFLQTLTRIIRNFFYLTKGVRKWLAIHYNEGIIPDPPMRYGRSFRVARSTPVSATSNGFGVSLKQSPIERRYSG